MTISRDDWLKMGWCRGAFLDLKSPSNKDLISELPTSVQSEIEGLKSLYLIPVLNDCALVNPSFEVEPYVQIMLCSLCDKNDAFINSKNPRRYHFPVIIKGEEVNLECHARHFFIVNRETLLAHTPENHIDWNAGELDRMLNWIADRIRQPTFPDEWNKRLEKKSSRFKSLWKTKAFSYCSGVYFKISPFGEILPEEKYKLKVFLSVPDKLSDITYRQFIGTHAQAIVERMQSIFTETTNIDVEAVDVIAESQFTKEYERTYKRWILEYYSYNSDDAEIPTEHIP